MPNRVAQAVTRASAGFILDQVRLGRGPLDFTDALILVAITQANVEPILRDPALNRRFATYDCAPPDELRRPISMNAVSQSLNIPFETVRRRVTRLAGLGFYKITASGVIVPGWVVKLGSHRAAAEANYERTRALYQRLGRLGAAPPPPPAALPWTGAPPLRAVARATAEYLLRIVSTATGLLGDVGSAAVWLEILRSTHEHLPEEVGFVGEDCRPVRVAALAKRLGMPQETVRRRVADLMSQGACQWASRGVILTDQPTREPEFVDLLAANQRDLARMFTGLAQLGVLAAWDREAELAA